MSADGLRSYRFATEAQWSACLLAGARREGGEFRPYPAPARPGVLHAEGGAFAPAVAPDGEILWRDAAGQLLRLRPGDESPAASPAPTAIGCAHRMVAISDSLWVDAGLATLQRHERETLAQVVGAELPGGTIIDLTAGGCGTVLVLVEEAPRDAGGGPTWRIARVDRAGRVVWSAPLAGVARPKGLVWLQGADRLVLLTEQGADAAFPEQRLWWCAIRGGAIEPTQSVTVAALRPCFHAQALGSDARERVLLAGREDHGAGAPAVVILGADGGRLADLPLDPLDAPVEGVAAGGGQLVVAGPRGLVRFVDAEVVPDGADVSCALLTPALQAPESEDQRRWLRVEVRAALPEGTRLEISVGGTDDRETRDRLDAVAADASLPAARRMARLLGEPEVWRPAVSFAGRGGRAGAEEGAPFAAPLFEVRTRWLWVCVGLVGGPGARLPGISAVEVLYPGRTLMENLPAVYRREEAQPDSFLRALVGVLEATTQELDGRIAAMGSRIHPAHASGPWLDFVARWLGLPWDDALDEEQKRRILGKAAALASTRGTRAGLEALLGCLIPGSPRRFRVSDLTADVGFAIAGGDGCPGSRLPALLAGASRWSAELGVRVVLGATRLPCPGGTGDGAAPLAGRVRIDVAATAGERQRWEPWLAALVAEMLPLSARAAIRWFTPRALQGRRLDGELRLEAERPLPHLGTDAVTGEARLPDARTRLSASASGSDVGTRLH